MKNIFFAFFLLFTFHLFSQTLQAELIFTDGTSVEGYGTITSKNKIMFRVEPEDELEVWEHYVVKGIYLSSLFSARHFEYVKVKEHLPPKLMEVISEGKVNLYKQEKIKFEKDLNNHSQETSYFNSNRHLKIQVQKLEFEKGIRFSDQKIEPSNFGSKLKPTLKVKFYLKRKNEEIATNITNKFKKVGLKYFDDCETIKEMFETKEFRKYSKKEIVDQYNVFCE